MQYGFNYSLAREAAIKGPLDGPLRGGWGGFTNQTKPLFQEEENLNTVQTI